MRYLATCTIIALAVVSAPISVAANEFAGAQITASSQNFTGLSGNQEIRTGLATVNGISYVHPTQVDTGASGNGFVAIGTYKGAGTSGGGTHDCADDYDAGWSVYVDGVIGGTYFCYVEDRDAYNVGDNPPFKITYDQCPTTGNDAWLMRFGGTLWRCLQSNQHMGSRVIVVLETVGSNVDRNIDVKYTNLEHRSAGTGFVGWGSAVNFADPNYTSTEPSTGHINAFLAPLD